MFIYDTFYNIEKRPFSLMPDPEFFYFSKSSRFALSLMELGVANAVPLIVVLGDEGIGKTSIVQHFTGQLSNEYKAGIITAIENQSPETLLSDVLKTLQVAGLHSAQSVYSVWSDLVNGNLNDGRKRILIIDDAEHLSFDAINILLESMEADASAPGALQIIFSGHSQLTKSFKYSHMESWIQAAGISYRIQPLTREETAEYIRYRLTKASAEERAVKDIFDRSGLDAVFEHSKGVPQRINFLCDSVLDFGRVGKTHIINGFWVNKTVEKWNESRFKGPEKKANVSQSAIYKDSGSGLANTQTPVPRDPVEMDVFDTLAETKVPLVEDRELIQPPPGSATVQEEIAEIPPTYRSGRIPRALLAGILILGASAILYQVDQENRRPDPSSSVGLARETTQSVVVESTGEAVAEADDLELLEEDSPQETGKQSEFSAFVPEDEETEISGSEPAKTDPLTGLEDDANQLIVEKGEPISQADSEEAALETEQKEQRIQALIDQADRQLTDLNLSHPKGKNAYETYRQILEIDPDDERASAGLQKVADKYFEMAEFYRMEHRYKRSYTLIMKGLDIKPRDERLLSLEKAVVLQWKKGRTDESS